MPASASRDIRDTSAINARLVIDNFPIACRVPAIPEGFCHLTIARATVCARRMSPGTFAIGANRDTLRSPRITSMAACPAIASTQQIAAPPQHYRTTW